MKKKKTQHGASGKKDDGAVDYSILLFGDDRPDAEKVRGLGVLLEDIDSKMSQVIEKVESSEETLGTKISEVEKNLSGRMDLIEAAVTHHSKILNEHSARFTKIDDKLLSIENKIDRIDDKLDNHENRITALEKAATLS